MRGPTGKKGAQCAVCSTIVGFLMGSGSAASLCIRIRMRAISGCSLACAGMLGTILQRAFREGRQITSPSPRDPGNVSPLPVIWEDPVPKMREAELTESSLVPRARGAEMTGSSLVATIRGAEKIESSFVPRVLRAEMTGNRWTTFVVLHLFTACCTCSL